MQKSCTTPGCTHRDFHSGPHSFEENITSSRCSKVSYSEVDGRTGLQPRQFGYTQVSTEHLTSTKEANKFQLDLNSEFMKRVLSTARSTYGEHLGIGPTEPGLKAKDCVLSKSSIFYAQHIDSDGRAGHFAIGTPKELVCEWIEFHANSAMRDEYYRNTFGATRDAEILKAQNRMNSFCKALDQTVHIKDGPANNLVYTLDGDLSNRNAFDVYFSDHCAHSRPSLVTWEIDPCVALAQKLLIENDYVRFTGADNSTKFGYGVDGNLDTSPPGLEYLICNRLNSKGVKNRLITAEDCEKVVGLYLDYCGGPIGGKDYEGAKNLILDTLSHLPRLCVFAITMSKRQRRGLEADSQSYLPSIHGFAQIETFTDNPKVVCWLYKRIPSVPRVLLVKWNRWFWSTGKTNTGGRRDTYKMVIRSYDTSVGKYVCYSVDDDVNAQVFDFTSDDLSSMTIKECDFKDDIGEGSGPPSSSSFSFEDNAIAILKRKEDEAKYERLQLEVARARKKVDYLNAQFKDEYEKVAGEYVERVSMQMKSAMKSAFEVSDGCCAFEDFLQPETLLRLYSRLQGISDREYIANGKKQALENMKHKVSNAWSEFEDVDQKFTDIAKKLIIKTPGGKKRVRPSGDVLTRCAVN
jgi:hypothetical protein